MYNKGPNGWTLNQSYPSPAGKEGHFGYAVAINSNVTAIGAYGFGTSCLLYLFLAISVVKRYVYSRLLPIK